MQSIRSWTSRMDFGVLSFQNLHITSSLRKINKLKYVAYDQPLMWHMGEHQNRMLTLASHAYLQGYQSDSTATTSMSGLQKRSLMINALHSRQALFPLSVNHLSSYRAYSSLGGSKPDGLREAEVLSAATSRESALQNTDSVGNDWLDMLNQACLSAVDAAVDIGKKTKEASEELVPYIQQLFDSHPYLKDVIVPVGGTLSAAVLAWVVMPRILRKLHMYGSPGPVAVLSGNSKQQIPYEASFWSALENPARYLTIFMAFTQLGVMIAPTTSQYLPQAWRGAVVISFVWFLHRWKSNVITRALANQVTIGLDQDKLMALDKLSSVGLLVLGTIALAEACGVAVQSILTVGGIGGVATAFAARDILGNVLSGLSLQFIKPFSIGDNIKAGSIEGQVVEMGLTTISLINSEKFPITAPNSLFSSQVILNKSRAQWRAIEMKIPVRIDDLEKIPLVAENIKSMLSSNPKVVLGKEAPYCYLSRIENFYAELTIGCNLKNMRKDEFYSTEQEILLKAAQIIKQNGAELGSSTLLSH